MIVEDEQDNSNYNTSFDYLFDPELQPNGVPTLKVTRLHERSTATTIEDLLGVFAAIQSEQTHINLRKDLMAHLWQARGTETQDEM